MKRYQRFSIDRAKASFILFLSILFFLPFFAFASEKEYYYLQIASFRVEDRAVVHAENLRNAGQNSIIINGENLGDIGYWYRVYLGPYSTREEADLKKIEIIDKSLADVAIPRKRNTLIPEKIIYAEAVTEEPGIKFKELLLTDADVSPPNERRSQSNIEKINEDMLIPLSSTVSAEYENPRIADSSMSGETANSETRISEAEYYSEPEYTKEMNDIEKRGKGRNINKGIWGIGIKHFSLKTETDLTKRQLATSYGNSTTRTEIPITDEIINEFPTTMQIDHLNIRFGLSESFEAFAGIGAVFSNDFSEAGLSYGGGIRLNLFQTGEARVSGIYGAVQGEYIAGEHNDNYIANSGETWGKEADFKSFNGKIEFGIAHRNLNLYTGCSFLTYKEETERRLLDNLPGTLTSAIYMDELDAKDKFGIFGGMTYYLTPSLYLLLEGQYGNQKGGSASVAYHF